MKWFHNEVLRWENPQTQEQDLSCNLNNSPTVTVWIAALRILPDSYNYYTSLIIIIFTTNIVSIGQGRGYLIVTRFSDYHHTITVVTNTFAEVSNVIRNGMHCCSPVLSTHSVSTDHCILCGSGSHFNWNWAFQTDQIISNYRSTQFVRLTISSLNKGCS